MYQLFPDRKSIEYVKSYGHLGHVIIHYLNDTDDIQYRRRCLIGQINSVLCFLGLDSVVQTSLLKSYSYSLYGSKLWVLNHGNIEHFCGAQRKGPRHSLGLQYDSHSVHVLFLPNTMPPLSEICTLPDLSLTVFLLRHLCIM